MKNYHALLKLVRDFGEPTNDRTGVGTKSLFGAMLMYDLRLGFPAVTTKKLAFRTMAAELSMFVQGKSDLNFLHARDCHIWDANGRAYKGAKFAGDLGRIYGVQWRDWQGKLDQLTWLINEIRTNPTSRRLVVTAWQPAELDQMCLPPCHIMFQCRVFGEHLDLQVYLRSLDLFLGAPFDIASYALLQHLIAKETGLTARYLRLSIGDAHIYNNHVGQVNELLSRKPYDLPKLQLSSTCGLFTFEPTDAVLGDYKSPPPIKAEMAV